MLNDYPDPKEVSDFHFLQLRTLRIIKENEVLSSKPVNLITSASKYDLLFVGVNSGFKVLRLEDILAIDDDKEDRSISENFPSSFVSCDTPVLLAVNATQTALAVCAKNVTGIVIMFYSLSNFPGFDSPWQPFCSKVLSSSALELKDFVWNPALECLYAFCLSDGSLHVHELSQNTIKPTATLPNANVQAVCWSPKGKQLVAGKQDGSFSQFKPSLDVVSTVMPPALEDGPVSVTSLCWISTTMFAVVYVANDTPNLFIVSTPKGGAVSYTNFSDVCLGNNSFPDQKYLMHFEPSWGILVCASFDSIEIAVFGSMPNIVQWDLKEDGKALLPGKNGALNAVGMTVMYSAQKQIIISDSVSHPPMPVMFILTNNGLLVSFHMVNEKTDAPTLVSAPLPVELKICSVNGSSPANTGPKSEEKTEKKSFFLPSQPLMSSSPITGKSAVGSQVSSSVNLPQVSHNISDSTFTLPQRIENTQNLPGNQKVVANSNKSEAALSASSVVRKNSQLQNSSPFFVSEKENEVQSNTENSYMTAVISEIQSFDKELQDLKQLQNSLPTLNIEEDMASLKGFALNMQNFQKDISETMKSLSNDIYTLKNVLLESFVLFEEASSRERRRNDHSYITMLKERSLDPITARHMQKLNQLLQYLHTQLQEVNNKLDQDRILHMSNKKNLLRNNYCISSTEAIYKTIVNNQKIVHNLRKEIDMLSKRADAMKLRNITNSGSLFKHHKRLQYEDLSKLADEFLQVKVTNKDEEEYTPSKKLSPESQSFLENFLKKSTVLTVRPTAVYSSSQSRLLSHTLPSDDHSGPEQTQNILPKTSADKEINEYSTSSQIQNVAAVPKFSKESTPVKPYFPVYEPVTSTDIATTPPEPVNKNFPVYEPITPPSVASTPPEPVNKTYTCIIKENNSESISHPSSTSSAVNLNQEIGSSLLSGMKSTKEFPKFSFASEMKSPTSEATSTPFFKPFSFTPSTQKDSQFNISKPLTVTSSSAPFVSGFQFGQKDSFWSPPAVVSSTATSLLKPDLNSIAPESTKLKQQDRTLEPHSNAPFTVPTINNTNSIFSEAKTSSMSALQAAEKRHFPKNQDNENLAPSVKNSKGFFFESNKTEPAKKDENTANANFQFDDFSFTLTPVNKPAPAINQTSSNQKQNLLADSVESTNKNTNCDILSNQAVISPVLRDDNLIDSNNLLDNSSCDLSTLKQPVSVSDTPSEPVTVSSSNIAIESVMTVTPSSTSTIVSPTTTTETVSSQSGLSVSKPPSPPLTPLPSQNISFSSSVLFGETTSTTSLDNSTTGKSDTAVTPNEIKQAPVIEQSQSETQPFSSPKTTSSETSVTPLEQPPASTTVPQVTVLSQPESTADTQTIITVDCGQPTATVTQTHLFGKPSETVAQTTLFGQPTLTSNFSSSSGGFFSQTPAFGASDTTAAVTTAAADFSNQSSTFSFGKPAFGQTGSFGLAKSFFGQNTTSFTQAATPSSFSFSQSPNSTFGQGSFFSGLGGKPSEENASKNVFGISSGIKSSDTNNLFKNSSVKSFGAANGSSFTGTGGFSSGSGSVAQSGFGSFQQSPTQQSGGFGAAPTFGGSPAFGSPPAFGGSSPFGSGNALQSVFGQQQVSSNFSNFANASSPTFGSLASQNTSFSNPPSFGSPTFGSAPAFGTSSFGSQSPGFGSPSSPPGNTSAFTQWRN